MAECVKRFVDDFVGHRTSSDAQAAQRTIVCHNQLSLNAHAAIWAPGSAFRFSCLSATYYSGCTIPHFSHRVPGEAETLFGRPAERLRQHQRMLAKT